MINCILDQIRKTTNPHALISAFRWPQHLLRTAQHLRPHRDVHVLPVLSPRTPVPEVPLVEEVSHLPADGKTTSSTPAEECFLIEDCSNLSGPVCGHHGARVPAALHRLQLPEGVRLVDRNARRHVLLPVQRVLPEHVQSEQGE